MARASQAQPGSQPIASYSNLDCVHELIAINVLFKITPVCVFDTQVASEAELCA
jgi:hypothetical protein